jgi:hypothetical protein
MAVFRLVMVVLLLVAERNSGAVEIARPGGKLHEGNM